MALRFALSLLLQTTDKTHVHSPDLNFSDESKCADCFGSNANRNKTESGCEFALAPPSVYNVQPIRKSCFTGRVALHEEQLKRFVSNRGRSEGLKQHTV